MAENQRTSKVLILAAIYNWVWGASVVLFPSWFFDMAGMDRPAYPQIWQCVGMIVGVYGIGYWIAAYDPERHWPIVLVGLLGKILGPIGFIGAVLEGSFTLKAGLTILTNDLIWWVPFTLLLWRAFKGSVSQQIPENIPGLEETLNNYRLDTTGETLADASQKQPLYLLCLRHFGCTFCMEALDDLKQHRERIRDLGMRIVFVHNSDAQTGRNYLTKRGWVDTPAVSDPSGVLYASLGLSKGTFAQLFGWRTFKRGFSAVLKGNGIGKLAGDGFQMPGLFIIEDGQLVRSFRHETAGDIPPYCEITEKPA